MTDITGRRSVLFINRVFPPNPGATGQLLAELTGDLANMGMDVRVMAARRQGGVETPFSAAGVSVERVPCAPSTRRSLLMRAASVVSIYPFMLLRLLRSDRNAVWVSMSDPPLIVAVAALIGRWRGARLVHWSQDIYPDVAVELGVIPKNGVLANVLGGIASWALRRQDIVICLGACMRDRLLKKGVHPDRISIIQNWVDPDKVRPVPQNHSRFRVTHGLEDRPVVMYSGNLGRAHSLMPIIEAAALLRRSLPEAVVMLIGEGAQKARLVAECQRRSLDNVRFLPFQPEADLADTLSAANLHLVAMEERLCGLVVPSKIYGVLAAARPTLFLGPVGSEVARVLDVYDCGETVSPAGPTILAQRIHAWLTDLDRCRVSGDHAALAAREFYRSRAVASFAQELTGLASITGQLYCSEQERKWL